jgi:hypothetical protein
VISIFNYQGNANQNHKELPHTCYDDCYQKKEEKSQKLSVDKDVQREPLSLLCGNIN